MPIEDNCNKLGINLANVTDEKTRTMVEKGVGLMFCNSFPECTPEFNAAPCETVVSGEYNSFVVLGRDRNSTWASGNGGKGMLQCGMIDLVAGRGQLIIADNKKNKKDILQGVGYVGPMFHSDAARIYITQKAEDIDQYFGLKPSGGPTSKMKSAVAAKADQIRLIGREKVKIYCGRGNWDGFETGVGETNSLGERLQGQVIELQVGNQELHPAVLGNKLVDYLKGQQEVNRKVYKQLLQMNIHLGTINAALAVLTFGAPPFSKFTQENISNIGEDIGLSLNSIIQRINYLDNDLVPGQDHILSDSVFTT
jgi:hypothetical protein|tara:strand:- start:344 stop:1273 length:930 start_codon:yes stop_codon:yes gene_type:complete